MNPSRVDFLIDLAYGVLIFLSITLILAVETSVGVAFGLGALVSYVIHVAWKMARFDPEWMTREVTDHIEETITEEVTESVGEKVTQEVTESVGEKVTQEVTESVEAEVTEEVTEEVEETISEEIDSVIDRIEDVNERIDRRPREDEIEAHLDEMAADQDDRDREKSTTGEGSG